MTHGGPHLSGCLSSSEYVIQIIFHLTGGCGDAMGVVTSQGKDERKAEGWREGNIYRWGQTVRGREAIRLSESTQVRGGVRWGPSESFKDVRGGDERLVNGEVGCRRADCGLILTKAARTHTFTRIKTLLVSAIVLRRGRSPRAPWNRMRGKAGESAGYVLAWSELIPGGCAASCWHRLVL